ncbi:MAG TPA: ABC transporter permease [Candidatus Acidoferrum sp.]|nr:ABC transporter permease [Candidatus Acidoferrum sp.]
MVENFIQDIRYASRGLRRNPGFALVCILTLALGIGANTAIFTVINAVLIRPVPGVANPGELVTFERLQKNNPDYAFGYPDYLAYRDQNQSFTGLAARCRTALALTHGTTERITGELVSGNYFAVLGVHPASGRVIAPEDVQADDEAPVAVLSYALWQRVFGSDPQVAGKGILLNGHSFTVVGVAAAHFEGTAVGSPTDVWMPLTMQPEAMPRMSRGTLQNRNSGWIEIFGRLKPRVSVAAARSEMQAIAGRLAVTYPESNEHRSVELIASFGMDPDDRAALQKFFGLLIASVGLLLLISCSNVANLLLSRADSRRKEVAVRLALGASRGQLVRQLLTEGLLLSFLAGGLGLLLAPWSGRLILAFRQPLYALRNADTSPDARVLGFTLMVTLLTGVLFSLAPALHSSRPDLVVTLKDNAPGAGRRSRLRSVLVSSQVALSLVLLVVAGVTVRKMQKIVSADPGFNTGNLLMMSISPSLQGYSEPQAQHFYEELLERVGRIPGIQSASLAATVPPEDWSSRVSIFYEGQVPPLGYYRGHEFEVGIRVDMNNVAPNYLQTMGIPILEGRDFTERDQPGAPLVAIVSERLAQRLWPDQDAVGKRIEWPSWEGAQRPPFEIIGVSADAKYRSLVADPPLLLYLPEFQNYNGGPTLVIHTSVSPAGLLPAVRSAVASLDPSLPVFSVKTMSDQVDDSLWQPRMAAGILGSFSILALVLAAVGLYGVVSQWMGQRTREIGIRMALGARPEDVMRLVLGYGAGLAFWGIVAGTVLSSGVTHLVSALLFGVSGTDVLTMSVIAVLLLPVALAACYVPARRAMRVDPVVALRFE